MTTLLIDDDLGAEAKRAAAEQGKSLEEFVGEALRQALNGTVVRRTVRSGLPVMRVSPATPIDPEMVQRTLQEEGF